MKKVSLKEQIENVENQSLSGIYSKEDVLALLNNVEATVEQKSSNVDMDEFKAFLRNCVIDTFRSCYNAADFITDEEFTISYRNEVEIEECSFDYDAIADEVDNCFNEALTQYNEALAQEHIDPTIPVSDEEAAVVEQDNTENSEVS